MSQPPLWKVLRSAVILLGIFGVGIWAVDWHIDTLPSSERSSAWVWFAIGWITSAIAVALLMLPSWFKGTMLPDVAPTNEETTANSIQLRVIGGTLATVSASTGLIGPSVAVGLGGFAAGGITAAIGYAIAFHTTKRGRAMLDRSRT